MEDPAARIGEQQSSPRPGRTGLSDTSPEAQRVLDDIFRSMPVAQKWRRLEQAQRSARVFAAAGYYLRDPGAAVGGPENHLAMSQLDDDLSVVRHVAGALDKLAIAYALGGSMASSIYGLPRHTQDADLTVDPFPGREQELADCFHGDYYVSVPAMREANQRRLSFNIIATSIGFKVDIFVRKDRAFEQSALSRRVPLSLPDRPDEPLFILSAEDVVLFKLEWYRLGNEASERQWLDVQHVLRIQAEKLDREYLAHWAADLGVADLLSQALSDAGL